MTDSGCNKMQKTVIYSHRDFLDARDHRRFLKCSEGPGAAVRQKMLPGNRSASSTSNAW